jgi:pimeloyl-ACP methyl ester carboxylesterase
MAKTLIYLHGAFDGGIGVASISCGQDGELRQCCQAAGLNLIAPVNNDPPLFATNWHLTPHATGVIQIAQQEKNAGKKVYLAGHSMGGRGALMIGLANQSLFDGLGAIAPALGEGVDRVPLRFATKFTPSNLRTALTVSPQPTFIGYATQDVVVRLNSWDFHNLQNRPNTSITNDDHAVTWPTNPFMLSLDFSDHSPFLGPHNDLVAATATDLVEFFSNLPN